MGLDTFNDVVHGIVENGETRGFMAGSDMHSVRPLVYVDDPQWARYLPMEQQIF